MDSIVSRKIRWLAVATGFLTAIAGSLGFGILFSIIPSFMVVGAILQPRFPRLGRGLMLAGALWLSAWVFPYGGSVLLSYKVIGRPDVIGFAFGSVVLVAFCDVALVIEEVRIRRNVTPG